MFKVSQVLVATACFLVGFQIIEIYEGNGDSVNLDNISAAVTQIECHPVDGGHDIYPEWRIAKLYDSIGGKEIIVSQPHITEPERRKNVHEFIGVVIFNPDPDIKIARVAGIPVQGDRVTADHEIVNASFVE